LSKTVRAGPAVPDRAGRDVAAGFAGRHPEQYTPNKWQAVRSGIPAFGVHIHRGSLVTFPSLAPRQLMEPDSAFASTPAKA
jgi:hypothetical protein